MGKTAAPLQAAPTRRADYPWHDPLAAGFSELKEDFLNYHPDRIQTLGKCLWWKSMLHRWQLEQFSRIKGNWENTADSIHKQQNEYCTINLHSYWKRNFGGGVLIEEILPPFTDCSNVCLHYWPSSTPHSLWKNRRAWTFRKMAWLGCWLSLLNNLPQWSSDTSF